MNRSLRQSVIAGTVAVLAATAVGLGINSAGIAPGAAPAPSGEGAPGALGKHLEDLKRAAPGGQELLEGPGSAAEAAFQERAYPDSTISVGKVEAAKESFQELIVTTKKEARAKQGQAARAAKGRQPGAWTNVGPSRALYPFTERRNNTNYVPNEYVAGGRVTDLAIATTCVAGNCKLYITPAGGGVWRTDDALAVPPVWKYLGGPLGINAAGTVTIDPRDASGNTIWVGTGEANTCGSGCVAGVGLYRSTDGGDNFTGPFGEGPLGGKGIGEIVVDPRPGSQILYAATTTALRGMSSVCCSGVTRPVPGASQWGLYKSSDNGTSWQMIHNGTADETGCTGSIAQFNNTTACSPRGVRHFELDPLNPDTMYAGSYARGIWRSIDSGANWEQIKPSLNPAVIQTRPAFDVVAMPDGVTTRMYVHEGNIGAPYSRLFRSDSVATGVPVFLDLSSSNEADPGYATYNQCGGQCWYDLFVTSPDGHPDMVYTGGSYVYGETAGISNGRAVVRSTDAGVSGTDMTMDDTSARHPNALHPDQHALVVHPTDPDLFFEANDGGLMRSTGEFASSSDQCAARVLTPAQLARCEQLLSIVPAQLIGMNDGLNTLQFISLSVSPFDNDLLQGGTQDNGTWQNDGQGGTVTWENTMIGDGGASGFDAKVAGFRMHNFFDATTEVQFSGGDIDDWIWTADPIFGQPGTQFYAPIITDPVVSGTMFAGTGRTVFRTKTFGLGDRSIAEAQRVCNTWDGTFEAQCGDWERAGQVDLTSAGYGDRAAGAVAAVERSARGKDTAWAATTTGRLFITTNAATANPASVSWSRLDGDSAVDPNRFVSSIDIDPANPNIAYVSYSGYSQSTPGAPGHVFKVVWNGRRATWTNLSYNLDNMPVTDLVRDDRSGDLYASTDFGVLRLPNRSNIWVLAASGMPRVEVAGLTISPDGRILYAASHGLSAWQLRL